MPGEQRLVPPEAARALLAQHYSTALRLCDLTALTTAQLYSLSSRRHRDESREQVRRAQEERDRAYVSLEQSQRWLERANEHLERMEENAREAHRVRLYCVVYLSHIMTANLPSFVFCHRSTLMPKTS